MFFGLPASGVQKAIVTVIESPKCANVPFAPVKRACTFFIGSTQSLSRSARDEMLRGASAGQAAPKRSALCMAKLVNNAFMSGAAIVGAIESAGHEKLSRSAAL